jgi:peptidoglycan/LPS O-acetylase OafA/YrhL
LDTSFPMFWFFNGVYTSLFCGPAAVIVFFIISGFCIHYPYRNNWDIRNTIPFLGSRMIRICGPILIVTFIYLLMEIDVTVFHFIAGWSIICEICYYLLYPFLRRCLKTYHAWIWFFFISLIPTLFSFIEYPINLVNYPGVGPIYVIFLGFPCWILGVLLCYKIEPVNNQPTYTLLFSFRVGIFITALGTHILALQEIIGHPFTLNFFAVFAFFWLRLEILFYKSKKVIRFGELLGKSSYSIYLMHGLPFHILLMLELNFTNKFYTFIAYWTLLIPLTAIFFFLIERPFHKIASRIKNIRTRMLALK